MRHIYWEKQEIPIPGEAYVNHSDGRVFIFLREGKVLEKSRRLVIGRAATNATMYPNDAFREKYPSLWEQYYGSTDKPLKRYLRSGMYSLCLGAGHDTGIYPLLNNVYGPLYANAIMDFSMYSMLTKSDVAQTLKDRLAGEVTFSKNELHDSWLSDMFSNKMTEDQSLELRRLWIEHCKSNGVTSAWISIDGSNNDCSAKKCELAEPGNAKSHTSANIVSYMYAINAETGMPITYMLYNGGKIDAKAFIKMRSFLGLHGINTNGVLLDRGFCTPEILKMLEEDNIPYVVMMKGDTSIHKQMYKGYSSSIRWDVRHAINEDSLFGISSGEKHKLFSCDEVRAYANFYYDGLNGTERSMTLIRKIMREKKRVERKITDGKDAEVAENLARYMHIEGHNGRRLVVCDYDRWQSDLDSKGFYTIATSQNVGAEMTNALYNLRDSSETQYMFSKSQLGFDVTRTHSTESIESKFLVCFVSSILRSKIQQACKEMHVPTNQMFLEMDRMSLFLTEGNIYISVHDESRRQKELLASVGVVPSDLDAIAEEFNMRNGPICSQYRTLSDNSSKYRKKPGRKAKPKDNAEEKTKKPVGRPKGSKNKKTIEAESVKAATAVEKRKPGRPKGSKNKMTITTEAKTENTATTFEKRKPGRPKGSKNKNEIEEKPMRGRPKGSKNKKALEHKTKMTLMDVTKKNTSNRKSKLKTPQ